MRAIDTLYDNHYFRSRLEARWAAFFKYLEIKYEYEPEGFTDGNGHYYLPDFYLPDTYLRDREHRGVYIEIKPTSFEYRSGPDMDWFTGNLVLFMGTPELYLWLADGYGDGGYQLRPWWDDCMRFHACTECGATKIEFSEGNYCKCPVCGEPGYDYERLEYAAKMAIKQRFEHGDAEFRNTKHQTYR